MFSDAILSPTQGQEVQSLKKKPLLLPTEEQIGGICRSWMTLDSATTSHWSYGAKWSTSLATAWPRFPEALLRELHLQNLPSKLTIILSTTKGEQPINNYLCMADLATVQAPKIVTTWRNYHNDGTATHWDNGGESSAYLATHQANGDDLTTVNSVRTQQCNE